MNSKTMKVVSLVTLVGAVAALTGQLSAVKARGQAPAAQGPAANDPNKAFFPDSMNIPFILTENIPWEGKAGRQQHYNVMGDPLMATTARQPTTES